MVCEWWVIETCDTKAFKKEAFKIASQKFHVQRVLVIFHPKTSQNNAQYILDGRLGSPQCRFPSLISASTLNSFLANKPWRHVTFETISWTPDASTCTESTSSISKNQNFPLHNMPSVLLLWRLSHGCLARTHCSALSIQFHSF